MRWQLKYHNSFICFNSESEDLASTFSKSTLLTKWVLQSQPFERDGQSLVTSHHFSACAAGCHRCINA